MINVPANSNNYSKGRSGRKIEMIVIHHMAGILTAEQCGRIFQTNGRQASAHYGVGINGEVAQYVSENDTAWANGHWDSNCKSVTIETSNNEIGGAWHVSDTTLNALIRLVADVAKRNNLGKLVKGKNLCWHNMFAKTTCPGQYLQSKIDYIADEANKINGYVENKPNNKSIDEIAQEVINGYWGNGQDRKIKLQNAGYDYNLVQAKVNEILLGTKPVSNLKSIDEVAREVIQGKWGNGQDRKTRLANAGYNVKAVQDKVNQLL